MKARLLPLLGLLLAAGCKEKPPPPPAPPAAARPTASTSYLGNPADGKLHVYFFDVGQGDSALIVSPEGRTVLVDTGPASAVNHLVNRLPELLAARLDLVVLTHPTPDHYGGMEVLQKIAAPRRLLEPQLPENPSEYDSLLTALGSKGMEIFSPAPNPSQPRELTRLPLGGGAELTVLWPRAPSDPLLTQQGAFPGKRSRHEANSIVLRLSYQQTSVLFAGDSRAETETALLKNVGVPGSTLLKVSAHGADFASSEEFLQKVKPQAAIISVGASNKLGLPAPVTVDRLTAVNARIFRTDEYGEVHAVSDGKQFVLTTQKLKPDESPNTQHVFAAEEPQAAAAPPQPASAKPESMKAVPAKAVSAKADDSVDTSRFKKGIDLDAPGPSTAREERTGKKASQSGGEKYYASRNRPIFHRADCSSVKRISPQNLITYGSRQEALKERKPANDCHP